MRGEPSAPLHRQLRLWHGYLSAFAFLALLFFAATGIALNHPNLFEAGRGPARQAVVQLTPGELAQVRAAHEPGPRLAAIVGRRVALRGLFQDAQTQGGVFYVTLQGVRGISDIRADLATGRVEITVDPQPLLGVLNELHRAETARWPWRVFVDVVGVVLIATSLLGYALLLMQRFRLRTALVITGLSLVTIATLIAVSAR
jgi:hypothetical protein